MTIMNHETFLKLPVTEVAKLVRAAGPQVCVFPINGTRRWFLLEHGHETHDDMAQAYLRAFEKRSIEICKLCFSYGLDTILTPVFGGELLNRGDEYIQLSVSGMADMATHPDFLSFYKDYQVGVHFYGSYREEFAGTPYAYMIDLFDKISKDTAQNHCYRIFYGVFATDATETIAQLTIRHFQATGVIPTRRELIQLYYGDKIEKANIFIGFEKFNIFDYPLLGWGEESLYFTVVPSLYMDDLKLRNILYDYLFLRPVQDPDYANMPQQDFEFMRTYYRKNREATFGVGEMRGGIWYAKTHIQE
jgi:tuberculosinol/isotuberculosinol synthase